MSCPRNIDWKAYALKEMDEAARRDAAAHLASCDACREELSGLEMTLVALAAVREEDIPRRIAFVSDKVFEPRWWQRLFTPTFASACVLALAIAFHAVYSQRGLTDAEVNARIQVAVAREVRAEVPAQVQAQTAWLGQVQGPVMQAVRSSMGLVRY